MIEKNFDKGVTFSKLTKAFNRVNFQSGFDQLDNFIKNHALKNQKQNISQTWIAHKENSYNIIGYYSLSASSVEVKDLPIEFTKRLPAYPIPCVLIGKLAVDISARDKGIGKKILKDALIRSLKISQELGCFAVIVDAIDENAKKFYEHFGFIPFTNQKSLFLPIATLKSAF